MPVGVQCRRCSAVTPTPTKFCGTCGAPLVYTEEEVTVIAPAAPLPEEARRPATDDARTVLDQPALDPAQIAAYMAAAQPKQSPPAAPVVRAPRDDMRTLLDPPKEALDAVPVRARPSMRTYIAGSTAPTRDGLPPFTTPEMQRPAELSRVPVVAAAAQQPAHRAPAGARPGTERLPGIDPEGEAERQSSTAVFDYNDPAANPMTVPALPGLAPAAHAPHAAHAPPAAQPAAAQRPPGRAVQRTMLGMPSPVSRSGAAPQAPGPPRPAPGAPVGGGYDPTIRGMPTPNEPPASPASPPQGRVVARTALGMAALPGGGAPGSGMRGLDPMGAPAAPAEQAPSPTMELSQSMVGRMAAPQHPPLGRTGPLSDPRHEVPQGFGPPGAPPPFAPQPYSPHDPGLAGLVAQAASPEADPGQPLQPHIFPGAHPFSQPPGGEPGFGEPSIDSLESRGKAKKKGGRGCAVFLLLSGLVLLLGAGAAFAYFVWLAPKTQRAVTASVLRDAAGAEELAVDVSGAPAGTRVRFSGQERVVTGGRARFPMPATQLRIGENRLSLEVLRPNKAAQSREVQLVVDYRVRADLAPLAATPPGYDVVVDATPGTRVQVDGRAVTLDAAGHGTVRVALSAITGAQDGAAPLVHTVRYRVEPNAGPPSDGVLTTQIPRTTLTVDRPGPETITDRPTLQIAGGAEPGSTVTIDDAPVPLESGRFVLRRALEVGEANISVRAIAPGKAPSVIAIRVRRVADLEAESRTFAADPEVTYARLAVNPNLYRGRRGSFQGVVYNMRVEQGQTIIQLLVRDCPQGQRCALWVVFLGDTDATVGTEIRVLGTVGGEQTFRTPQGGQVTVPRVDASFVLAVRS